MSPFIKKEGSMNKTPKNLKKALKKKDSSPQNEGIESFFKEIEHFESLPWEQQKETSYYIELRIFVSELAKRAIGVRHSSDILDNWSDEDIKRFLVFSSSDDDDSSDSFDKHNEYEKIKYVFKGKLAQSIESESFLDLESFKSFYQKLKKAKLFTGTSKERTKYTG
jgi:hypothetical protein